MLGTFYLNAQPSVNALFGKAIQTDWTTQGSGIALSADGTTAYAIGGAGTKTTTEFVRFGDDNIAPGTEYNGTSTSGNQMLFLTKIDKQGNALWTVYSKFGEIGNNLSWVASVSDGVVAFLAIRHVENFGDKSVSFVDAQNNEVSMNWTLDAAGAQRHYRGVIMKVSDDGIIQWMRQIEVNHDGQPAATYAAYKTNTGQGIYPYAIAADDEDNIYIGGRQCTEFTYYKSETETVKIAARDVEGWNGDPQTSVGDLFITKLDKNGFYVNSLQTEGNATQLAVRGMQFYNGKLYIMGQLQAKAAGDEISLGGKAITAGSTYFSLISASLNADLSVNWFSLYSSSLSGSTMQTPGFLVCDDNLWILGKAKMQINIDGTDYKTNHTRDGLLLKVNATDGAAQACYIRQTNQAGFFDAFLGYDGYLYVGTHVLLNKMQLYKFDINDLTEPKEQIDLIASTSDTQGFAFATDGTLFTMTRGNSKTNKLGNGSTSIVQEVTKYSCNICAFQMPFAKSVLDFTDGSLRKTGTALADTEGFIYNETLSSGDIALQVTAGSAPSRLTNAGNRGNCLVTYSEYSSLKFTAPEGKAIQKIVFTLAGSGKLNFTAENGTLTENTWEGNADAVRFRATGTSYIAKAEVVYTDKDDATEALPALQYQEVNSIEAFNALENGTYAKLNLKDAEVTGISADGYSTVFLQDATSGAWIQYTSLNTSLQPGTKINGYIYCTKRMSSANPLVKETEDTPDSQIEATPIDDFTVAEYATIGESESSLFQLIKLQGASFEATSATAGTLTLGDETITVNNGAATANQQLHLIDGFTKGDKKENVTIVGILVRTSATKMQILPLELYTAETITLAVGWSTFVANDGCDFVVPDGATAYIITDADTENGTVTATLVSDGIIPDGAAVLISSEKDEITLTENQGEATATTDFTANLLKAGDGTTSFSLSDNVYALSEGLFMRYEGIVPEGKAYLQLTASSQAKLSIVIDGQATGISQTEAQKTAAGKQLFDLSGRRVERPAKGIYILNGRKVIVK